MILQKWKTFKIFANRLGTECPNKFTPRSDHAMLKDLFKNKKSKNNISDSASLV